MSVWKLVPTNQSCNHAIAICSFYKEEKENCLTLSFKIGDILEIKEECEEWYRGFVLKKPNKLGIFPKSFVKVFDIKQLNHADHSVVEIESILREWTSVWSQKYEECEKKKIFHTLMSYFKNLLNLKNVIVGNRASIDEIKDLKKQTASKILQGNSQLGLDVIAYDSNYNRLNSSDATTIFLYEELKKNNNFRSNLYQVNSSINSFSPFDDTLINDSNQINLKNNQFLHQKTNSNINQSNSRVSSTFCLKLSFENLIPGPNCAYTDENSTLCVNLFLFKENSTNDSYYLCENACFEMSKISNGFRSSGLNSSPLSDSTTPFTQVNQIGKCALFCDISEKDFELTKSGYKLYLVAYAIKNLKHNPGDRHASFSRVFAAGICDLGSNLCNLIYVAADIRHIQSSMNLNMMEYFESSIVAPKTLQELLNSKDMNDSYKTGKNSSKEIHLSLTFRCELIEATYKKACDQFSHLRPQICRKMDFPEIIMPDDFRNDFYITVIGGEFQKARNYEFVVNLIQFKEENGTLEEFPIDLSDENYSKDETKKKIFHYKSIVYLKQEKPKWNEVVNVSIPHGKRLDEIKKTYLRFLIRNRPLDEYIEKKDKSKIVGRCYLQITNEDGSAIQDSHSFLPMTKLDNEHEVISVDGCFIRLKTPPNINKLTNGNTSNSEKSKDNIEIKVKVVSTQLTQNVTLLNLLSFSTEPRPDAEKYQKLLKLLDDLLYVKDEQSAEIVKFLQAILDKLIEILLDLKIKNNKDSMNNNDHLAYEIHSKQIQQRVFDILVSIFQIIENQNKFASFRTVIDAYLNKNFFITLAHRPLLRLFYELITNICDKYSLNSFNNSSRQNSFPNLTTKKSPSHRHSVVSNGCISISNGSTFSYPIDSENENALNVIKSIEYIFKFAFKSRELLSLHYKSNNQQSDVKNDTFDSDIENIFNRLVQITSIKNFENLNNNVISYLTKIQSYILKYSITLMPILLASKRYSIQKISEFYIGFLQSKHVLETNFLSKLIKSKLFEIPESRQVIMDSLCSCLKNLLTVEINFDESKTDIRLELVGKVLSELMDVLERKNIGNVSKDINELSKILIHIVDTFLYFNRVQLDRKNSLDLNGGDDDSKKGDQRSVKISKFDQKNEQRQIYASILISIMRSMDASHFEIFFDFSQSFNSNGNKTHNSIVEMKINDFMELKHLIHDASASQIIIIKLLHICKCLLDVNTFAKDWFDLLILRNNVLMSALFHISERINRYHLADFSDINKQIWNDYFSCMVKLCTDACMQLETFNENKKKNVLSKYKDMRIKAASEIKKMWFNLADKKQQFIPNMVEPFMMVALIPIPEIHNTIIPLFFDMINCEFFNKGNMGIFLEFEKYSVPTQLITTLDIQVALGKGDIQFRNAFERILKEKFNAHMHLKKNVDFVKNVVELFELLVEYRDLRIESSDELKTFYLNEILLFYNNLERYDIYVKYVEILRQIHINSKNLVCAAHTLKLHAQLLNWTSDQIPSHLKHSSYPYLTIHKDLKELLFIDIINYFTKGNAWEKALEFSKILRERYDMRYELEKLSDFLRKQADLCESIIKIDRYECNYFLVGFFGKGFPRLLQNKQFVFMSEQFEQIITFRPRVESWFPDAQRISHSMPLSETELNSNKQYIQVISVQPVYEPKEKFQDLTVSTQILKYYHHNEVNKFKYTYRKESKLNEDNPTLWWLTEKSIVISDKLPNVVNFYPVTETIIMDISPVQNAINTVRERMNKLKNAYERIEKLKEVDEGTKSLVQGTVDPGVNGGLPKYTKFMDKNFKEANPDSAQKSDELKSLIIETINLADMLLDASLRYAPNDELLTILESEQLPKLKGIFELPVQATMRKKKLFQPTISQSSQNQQIKVNSNVSIDSTPKSSKQNSFLTDSQSAKLFMKQLIQSDNYSAGRNIISYLVGDKTSSSQLTNSSTSHRESISSIKSINSDDDSTRNKIMLDETVNPKRPLRPCRINTQNSTSSPSNSNQSSRPISHLSDDKELSSLSIQQGNLSNKISDSISFMQEEETNTNLDMSTMKPPPKPPKVLNTRIKLFNHSIEGNGSDQVKINSMSNQNISAENLENSNQNIFEQTKSTVSLNSLQFKTLTSKTTSDSILNRLQEDN